MKKIIQLTAILALVTLVAGLLLAGVNQLTKEPIEKTRKRVRLAAIKKVLPPCDNDPIEDKVTIRKGGQEWTFYAALQQGAYAGAAFQTSSQKGYGGKIDIMVGINDDNKVQAIAILTHAETPGLGAKIEEPAFKKQFAGKDIEETNWKVRKDGGDIDQITAATISSRAVSDAVEKGVNVYLEEKKLILSKLNIDQEQKTEDQQ